MWNRNKAENNLFDKPVEKLVTERAPERTVLPPPQPAAVHPPEPKPATDTKAVDPKMLDTQSLRKPAPTAVPNPSKGSVLGASLRFKGDLVADEDLVVQGQIEGSILHSRSLTIGADGGMKGDIRARRIVVEGLVTGDLYALECVTVRATGRVRGSIYAPRVAIAEGAEFNGRIDMEKAPAVPAVTAPSVVATAAADAAAEDSVELHDADAESLLKSGTV
jgi:cytoskeletal protein CcmA (bactofilin family)